MKYTLYIVHTNNLEKTKECLSKLSKEDRKNLVLLDNSNMSECSGVWDDVKVIETPVQFNTAQSYNFMRKQALRDNLDLLYFMHDDCLLESTETFSLFRKESMSLMKKNSRVGWVYADDSEANYDCKDLLCCYRCGMLSDVGEWDALRYPFYYLDLDFYNRAKKNWDIEKISINLHHKNGGSTTIKTDIERSIINSYYLEVSRLLYSTDWEKQ